jgi:hypothetical protein
MNYNKSAHYRLQYPNDFTETLLHVADAAENQRAHDGVGTSVFDALCHVLGERNVKLVDSDVMTSLSVATDMGFELGVRFDARYGDPWRIEFEIGSRSGSDFDYVKSTVRIRRVRLLMLVCFVFPESVVESFQSVVQQFLFAVLKAFVHQNLTTICCRRLHGKFDFLEPLEASITHTNYEYANGGNDFRIEHRGELEFCSERSITAFKYNNNYYVRFDQMNYSLEYLHVNS